MKTQPDAGTGQAEAAIVHLGGLSDLEDLAAVLVVLEDFLLHAGIDLTDELAAYPLVRPDDPHTWVRWAAGLLGEHASSLRALIAIHPALPTRQPIGNPMIVSARPRTTPRAP